MNTAGQKSRPDRQRDSGLNERVFPGSLLGGWKRQWPAEGSLPPEEFDSLQTTWVTAAEADGRGCN